MRFNSLTFLVFFAVVLVLHHLPLSWNAKKLNLLWLSYLFYAAWNPPFIVLLWFSTVLDWYCARAIAAARTPRLKRLVLALTVTANLGLLGYFKYGGFLLESFVALAASLGIPLHPAMPDIILPAGISFYTFQTMSYTIDVYRGVLAPARSFRDYALYVTFFPQLVVGPIVRARDFLPQCEQPKRATGAEFGWGLALMVLGLFEKTVVADGWLAPAVDQVFGATTRAGAADAWLATCAFAGQLFCDLAGYSTCALGAGLCLGFRLPVNFRSPLAAIGFADFWRRWHISLSTWLRDYLYIPLGGSRRGEARTYLHIMLTMLLGGLWHGASWTFVAWGGVQGALLCVDRAVRRVAPWSERELPGTARLALAAGTFGTLAFTFAMFRAQTFPHAAAMIGSMLGAGGGAPLLGGHLRQTVMAVMAAILLCQWLLRDTSLERVASRTPWWLVTLLVAAMLLLIAVVPRPDRAFIYFQF